MFNQGRPARVLSCRALAILCFTAVGCLLMTAGLHAQTSDKADKPARKVVHRVDADYPLDLQRAHISGVVRLDVVVSPSGSVENISVIGGNPVLVETALRAVKKWKWAPAEAATVLRINVNFDADKRNGPSVD
jgi:TonB family protein